MLNKKLNVSVDTPVEMVVPKAVQNMPTFVTNPSDWEITAINAVTISAKLGTYSFVGTIAEFNGLLK
jgi:hypothetical protein